MKEHVRSQRDATRQLCRLCLHFLILGNTRRNDRQPVRPSDQAKSRRRRPSERYGMGLGSSLLMGDPEKGSTTARAGEGHSIAGHAAKTYRSELCMEGMFRERACRLRLPRRRYERYVPDEVETFSIIGACTSLSCSGPDIGLLYSGENGRSFTPLTAHVSIPLLRRTHRIHLRSFNLH